MPPPTRPLKRAQIAHILRAAAAITNENTFILVGAGALIAAYDNLPLHLMMTPELDIQAPPGPAGDRTADLLDGSIGEGSQFHETFGYYAHGLQDGTALLPADWQSRAKRFHLPGLENVTCIAPDANDLALSKLCAWREKDQAWLRAALRAGFLDLAAMAAHAAGMTAPTAPGLPELLQRLARLPAPAGIDEQRTPFSPDAPA